MLYGVPIMSQYGGPNWESYIAFLLQPHPILLKFDSSSFSFALQRLLRYPYISIKTGSKGQKYVKNFSNIFHYCIMFSDSFNNSVLLHNALNTFLCILIVFPMLWLCFQYLILTKRHAKFRGNQCDMFFL